MGSRDNTFKFTKLVKPLRKSLVLFKKVISYLFGVGVYRGKNTGEYVERGFKVVM